MELISIVSCVYKDTLGEKVTTTGKYVESNGHVEPYTDVISLCAQLISTELEKKLHYSLQIWEPQKVQFQE